MLLDVYRSSPAARHATRALEQDCESRPAEDARSCPHARSRPGSDPWSLPPATSIFRANIYGSCVEQTMVENKEGLGKGRCTRRRGSRNSSGLEVQPHSIQARKATWSTWRLFAFLFYFFTLLSFTVRCCFVCRYYDLRQRVPPDSMNP
jgi:hypothetical protein